MGTTIRVVVIEDHGIVREGIRLTLDSTPGIEVVVDAATGSEGVSLFQPYRYQPGIDVIVTDYSLPDFGGAGITRSGADRGAQGNVFVAADREADARPFAPCPGA
jgi:DNA-binding NarL/FixJ family response regulator